MWQPATIERIEQDIQYCDYYLYDQPEALRFWNSIKIIPEKWQEDKMGSEGGGFWAVGIIGNRVIYYNDIEDGYNGSPYSTFGKIDEYRCSQLMLHECVESLYENIIKGV